MRNQIQVDLPSVGTDWSIPPWSALCFTIFTLRRAKMAVDGIVAKAMLFVARMKILRLFLLELKIYCDSKKMRQIAQCNRASSEFGWIESIFDYGEGMLSKEHIKKKSHNLQRERAERLLHSTFTKCCQKKLITTKIKHTTKTSKINLWTSAV
jgi:hypothetical protein